MKLPNHCQARQTPLTGRSWSRFRAVLSWRQILKKKMRSMKIEHLYSAINWCMAMCVRNYISGYLNMIGQSSCTAVDWAGVPVDERDRAVEGNHWPFLRSLSFTDKETVVLVIFALGIYLSIWHSSIWLDSHIDFWESYLNFQIIVRNFIMISSCVSRGPNGWEI